MLRFFFIILSILIVAYVLKGLVQSIITLLNRKSSNTSGNINSEETVKKTTIPYDKSKVVDADFEEIK